MTPTDEAPARPNVVTCAAHAAVALLLVTHVALVGFSAARQSPTVDEVAHLPAGISHWKFANFSLYVVNPPLVRMIAALPVLCMSPRTDWRGANDGPPARSEFGVGENFVAANRDRSLWLFTAARWACIPLSVLGGLVCYRWSADLCGRAAGILSLWLWCFSPNVLAHASLITPDVGASSLGVAACYLVWRWSMRPTWSLALGCGATLGLAELAKSTWTILFGLLPVIWLSTSVPRLRRDGILAKALAQFAAMLGVAFFLLNAGYDFSGFGRPLGSYAFYSARLGGGGGADNVQSGNRFSGRWCASIPVPLPESYVRGVDMQMRDLEGGRFSYLRGVMRKGGWWYYYLYALAVKVPIGTWLLAAIVAGTVLVRPAWRAGWRDELFLWAVPAVLLGLASSQTGLNQHLRYILPAFPFAFVFLGRAGRAFEERRPLWSCVVGTCLALSAISSLRVFPHEMSYFNELAGGPMKGHEHLLDSNIDWGQDLLELKQWTDRNAGGRPIGLAYFGTFEPRFAGIDYVPIPENWCVRGSAEAVPEWCAVSVNYLHGYGLGGLTRRPEYECFRRLRPAATAGYSLYIYHASDRNDER